MAKQQRRKHVPQRTCVVCRKKDAKRQLTRLVRTADAGVVVDPTGKLPGRGAYVCERPACWEQLLHTNLLERALKTTLDAAQKEALLAQRPGGKDEDTV